MIDQNYIDKQKEKELRIIRQSCLKAASSAVSINNLSESNIEFTGKRIVKLSKIFEAYIMEPIPEPKQA